MNDLAKLLDSKIVSILNVFMKNKGKLLYLREISKISEIPVASTFRILKKLSKSEIIEEVKISKFTFYRLPKKSKIEAFLK